MGSISNIEEQMELETLRHSCVCVPVPVPLSLPLFLSVCVCLKFEADNMLWGEQTAECKAAKGT
jgi:hypothetical protein